MSQQPTPEAVEAVARAIAVAIDSDWDTTEDQDAACDVATAAIAAYLAHQRQHEDTLADDLAAILPSYNPDLSITYSDHDATFTAWFGGPYVEGIGDTIPEAVVALRRQIEEGEG